MSTLFMGDEDDEVVEGEEEEKPTPGDADEGEGDE